MGSRGACANFGHLNQFFTCLNADTFGRLEASIRQTGTESGSKRAASGDARLKGGRFSYGRSAQEKETDGHRTLGDG